jgi:multiple sugar transport system ATP-binding protein
MSTLQLKHIDKRFGDTVVLHDIELSAEEGEFVALVGPSGCGKSTLLRIISGLEPTTGGDIVLDGRRVNDVSAAERGLAMVFQSYALYPHMTVYQNMAFGLENTGTPKAEIERKIGDAARMLQLDALLRRRPTQLSGGQRQRVAIGRAIVRNPKLFLFDEPLSNLDAELRVQMRAEIIALHQRLKTGMIYVTHDQVEAMTMADKIVVLRAGRVEQTGSPLELYNRPQNRFVAGFIGSPRMNFVDATVTAKNDCGVQLALAGFEQEALIAVAVDPAAVEAGAKVTLGVRPEHVEVVDLSGAAGAIDVQIAQVEQLGGHGFIHCTLPVSKRTMVVQFQGQTLSRAGSTVSLRIPPGACHVFSTATGEPAVPPIAHRDS